MNARRVLAITGRVLAQLRRDHRTLALLFVAPLLILTLFYFLLRGGGDRPAVGVVNLDRGPLGAAVTQQLLASSTVSATEMDQATAESRLRDGRLAGYVVLPADLSAAAAGGVLRPRIHLEGSQPGPAGTVVQATSQALVGAAASLLAVAGVRVPQVAPAVTYRYGGPSLDTLDYFGGAFVGLVVFFLVFVVTCVSFLRERSQGTLERLMASPLRRPEIVVGYMLGFAILALAQALEVLVFSLAVLRIHNAGSVLLIFGIETLLALVAVNLGIFLSTFARTEFQAVQFIPIVIVPQVLLSGVILPVSSEPGWLQAISNVLPLTYAVNALRDVMLKGADLGWPGVQLDAAVVLAFGLLAVAAAAPTLRRQVA
ncbi:MAG TPA: ABC-2 transporter permease [Candidatus Eisenbacteria bacterium]|nr:ABC-2 transporter permease [Candidatus Eisenbacteria bacterium]